MNKMKSKTSQLNRFLRIITTPVRALRKARDYYVRSMTNYADRMNCGNIMAAPGSAPVQGLPRSFSVNSARTENKEDYRELLRASSARNSSTGVYVDSYVRQQMTVIAGSSSGSRALPPRSRSVAMGRIDEDSPCCYFGDLDNNVIIINSGNNNNNNNNIIINVKKDLKYPRSKSHSVTRKVF